MRTLTVVTDGEKGRSFSAVMLAYATGLWEGSEAKTIRPIWATIVCSEAESGPFISNLRAGRKAIMSTGGGHKSDETVEFLRSAEYSFQAQRYPEGVAWTVFLPDLYRIDPGMIDPEVVKYAILPREDWLAPADLGIVSWLCNVYERTPAEIAPVVRLAPLACAYLDRRTRCPLIPDPWFYARVLAGLLDSGLAAMSGHGTTYDRQGWGRSSRYVEVDVAAAGLAPGLVVHAKHADLELSLASAVSDYEAEVGEERRTMRSEKEAA